MLASCRRPKPSSDLIRAARGFTLLEVLVVLALIGLLTAFSLPQFSIIRDRLTFNLNRESFERDLSGLRYLAFKEGRAVVLAGKYPRGPEDDKRSEEPDPFEEIDFSEPGQLRPVRPVMFLEASLNLPEAWSLSVQEPIVYQPSGFCGGGTVNLLVGDIRYVYDLKAPTCLAELK